MVTRVNSIRHPLYPEACEIVTIQNAKGWFSVQWLYFGDAAEDQGPDQLGEMLPWFSAAADAESWRDATVDIDCVNEELSAFHAPSECAALALPPLEQALKTAEGKALTWELDPELLPARAFQEPEERTATPVRSILYRCDLFHPTAQSLLMERRGTQRWQNDRYRKVREACDRNYQKLARIGVGPGSTLTWYRGTLGSGYNNKVRSSLLAHFFDKRRLIFST